MPPKRKFYKRRYRKCKAVVAKQQKPLCEKDSKIFATASVVSTSQPSETNDEREAWLSAMNRVVSRFHVSNINSEKTTWLPALRSAATTFHGNDAVKSNAWCSAMKSVVTASQANSIGSKREAWLAALRLASQVNKNGSEKMAQGNTFRSAFPTSQGCETNHEKEALLTPMASAIRASLFCGTDNERQAFLTSATTSQSNEIGREVESALPAKREAISLRWPTARGLHSQVSMANGHESSQQSHCNCMVLGHNRNSCLEFYSAEKWYTNCQSVRNVRLPMEVVPEDAGLSADQLESVNKKAVVHLANGHPVVIPAIQVSRSGSPRPYNRKPAFNRAFKQAVFEKIGKDDGSSKVHVTFTSQGGGSKPMAIAKQAVTVAKQLAEREQQRNTKPYTKIAGLVNIKPKPKTALTTYKELVVIDKKKMQEEIDSMPKPENIVEAERELMVYEAVKKFSTDLAMERTYVCIGCEDSFPSQFVLDDHLSRQSYQLTLECPQCLKKFTFTNKCRMYEHLHGEHGVDKSRCLEIVARYVTLQVLPRAQFKLTESISAVSASTEAVENGEGKAEDGDVEEQPPPQPPPPPVEAVEEAAAVEVKKEVVVEPTSTASIADEEDVGDKDSEQEITINTPITNGDESDELDTSVSCTECSRTFENEWALRTHFTVVTEDFTPEVCIPCKVELVTRCARKAHMRIHGLMEPFVCPDCGQRMFKKNVFLKHIRLHCLHYSILSEYTCPGCAETFSSADEQLVHLKVVPSHLRFEKERSYYKCNGCPKAFKSVAAHSKHDSCPGAGCTVVHMCNNCPQQTVFRSWTELTEHRTHAHPQLVWVPRRSKLYACYLCVHKSRTKPGLLDHLLKSHGKKKIDYMCRYCGVETDSAQALDVHSDVCAFKDEARRVRAPLCIPDRLPRLSSSSSVVSDLSTSATNLADVEQREKGPENVSYLAHTPSFNCHICTAECNSYNQLRDHVIRRHEGRGLIYECWMCRDRGSSASFFRQAALDKHMADVHKLQISSPVSSPTAHSPLTNGQHDSADDVPVKRMRLWNEEGQPYQCCRCDFSATSVHEFKDHIKEHKSSADTFQCAECGMCFPVQLALRRHLFAVHKVSDYAKYSRTQYMEDFERQLSDTQGKCPICKKQFEAELQLRKHLRTHGMMYINTRRITPNT